MAAQKSSKVIVRARKSITTQKSVPNTLRRSFNVRTNTTGKIVISPKNG